MSTAEYDPFAPGKWAVGVRTIQAADPDRSRLFPVEVWYPAKTAAAAREPSRDELRDAPPAGLACPLIIYSHHSNGNRRRASFLSTHLASHGYMVAALDHSEVIAPELTRGAEDDTPGQLAARIQNIIGNRVPDVRFLLDHLLGGGAAALGLSVTQVGLIGHSFGGWTVLATAGQEPRVRAVVAMAPGGSSDPRPGILPLTLEFGWDREIPVLFLAGDDDVSTPLDGIADIFDRAPAPRQLFVLRNGGHHHFADDVEDSHEALRAMTLPGEAAWIPGAMRPASEMCPGDEAHAFTRGLALAHLDAALRRCDLAAAILAAGAKDALAARDIGGYEWPAAG
jgi:dienelactone hydrolase